MTQGAGSHEVDKVIQECFGYKAWSGTSSWRMLLSPAKAAVISVLAKMAPKLAARLLAPCSLQEAECVLLKLVDGRYYLVRVFVPAKRADLSVFSRTVGRNLDVDHNQALRTFKLFWRLYTYSPGQGTFLPVPAMPRHLPRQIRRALETLRLINTAGVEWKTLNAAQKQLRRDMVPLYATPRALLQLRAGSTLKAHSYFSLFSLQFLEVAYLMYVGRWFLPVLILALHSAAVFSLARTLRSQRLRVMAMVNECRLTPLVWEGWVRAVSSHRLLPGDIVVLRQGRAVCDMIMLQGSCLVMESMLSGEAAQVRKCQYVAEAGVDYDPDKHTTCTVYQGTMVQQVWNPQASEDEVLAMVVRNGMNTTVGNMVREIVAPIKRDVQDDFRKDIFRLYAFAFCLQLLIHIPYFIVAPRLRQTPQFHVHTLLDMLLYAVPPGLPLMMLLIGTVGRWRLHREKMTLKFNEAMSGGACADVVAFDKTGTLTHSAAELHGVVPVQNGEFLSMQKSALRWPNRLKQAVAVCNSLNMVGRHTVAGIDMERSMFKAVEARFLDRETVVLPRQPDHTSSSLLAKLSIVKVMEFTSQTLRSGVVVWANDGPKGSALLFLRGAPATIRDLVQPASVPESFNQVMDDYSSKSFRLIAMAVGVIPRAAKLGLMHMTQQQVEVSAVNMQLLCLVVLTNNIHSDSKATISQLQEGGGLRTVMVTGDYHHTAVAVAKDVGMFRPDSQVVVIDTANHELQRDARMPGTPDSGSSSEAHPHPQPTPKSSLQARRADFAHGFCGTPQAECSHGKDATPSPVDSTFDEAVKGDKQPYDGPQLEQESWQSSLNAILPADSPTVMDRPLAKQCGVVAEEAVGGKKVYFEVPTEVPTLPIGPAGLPFEASSPRRQPADAVPTVQLSRIKLAPLARHPSKAASDSALLPAKGTVSSEHPLSLAYPLPSRLSLEGPPPPRQLSRVASLTRLSSETASLPTASPPGTSATSQDDSSFSRQFSARHKRVLSLSNHLLQSPVAKLLTPFQPYPAGSIPLHMLRSSSECEAHGLTFTCGAGRQHVDPCDAMTAMAEGSMQCAVTGEAFEMLLQLKEVSLLETVMRNAVIFSRMQPHQKGQVMDLLGGRGIHQPDQGNPRHIQGLGNTTVFCGDGINDLPALAAADVGFSIGAGEAFIAASVSTSQASVAGVCSFIRIGKGGHAMMTSLFKYMVVYQCIMGEMNCSALYYDGSDLSNAQMTVIDAEAMLIALAACLVPPLPQLNRHRSVDRVSKGPTLLLLFVMAACLQLIDVACYMLLASRPWFSGGNGTATKNPVATLLFLTGNMQLLAPLISLLLETSPYCQLPLRSKPMLLVSLAYTGVAYGTIVSPLQLVGNPLGLFGFPQSFRWQLGVQIAILTIVYTAVIRVTRRILACYERRRLSPV